MLAAFYQCYNNPVNFVRCLNSFRSYYPQEDIDIHNDGGIDYSAIAAKYSARYTHHTRVHSDSPNLVYQTLDPVLRYLRRLWDTMNATEAEYIILLEDDVRILKRHTAPFLYDINGCNRNEMLPKQMRDKLPGKDHFFGGCGGCVLMKKFFVTIPFEKVEEILRSVNLESYASDQCLTFIVQTLGGTIGDYPEFAEEWYPNIKQLKEKSAISFLHNYKNEYKDEFTLLEKNELDSLNVN